MPRYVQKALKNFLHPTPQRPQYAPHQWNQPIYGQKIQYATINETSPNAGVEEQRKLQSIIGTFLYYGRAVDPTILTALNDLATCQAHPTVDRIKRAKCS